MITNGIVKRMALNILKNRLILSTLIFFLITLNYFNLITFENSVKGENENITNKIITVNDDGGADYTSIQDAINNANIGDTIRVWAGTYYENVIVSKPLSLIGNGSSNTTIDGGKNGNVIEITADWVNVSGFGLINSGVYLYPLFYAGIKLTNVENITIENNNCSNNCYGIWLYKSNLTKIINNICLKSPDGIRLRESNFNNIKNNVCLKNEYGIFIFGYSRYNIIENNTSNLNDFFGITLDYNSLNNSIKNNTCNLNKNEGINIWGDSNYNTIINNKFCNNTYGIRIRQKSDLNIIQNNTINKNKQMGIEIENSSLNMIGNNSLLHNNYGMYLENTINNTIYNNNISLNNKQGIFLKYSNDTIIFYNTISYIYMQIHAVISCMND